MLGGGLYADLFASCFDCYSLNSIGFERHGITPLHMKRQERELAFHIPQDNAKLRSHHITSYQASSTFAAVGVAQMVEKEGGGASNEASKGTINGKPASSGRNLKSLRAGKIIIKKSNASKQRYSLKMKAISAFENLSKCARGTVGILIVLPATQQGDLILEYSKGLPPGLVVAQLEALQQQVPDIRLEEQILAHKEMQERVDKRGGESQGPTAPPAGHGPCSVCICWLYALALNRRITLCCAVAATKPAGRLTKHRQGECLCAGCARKQQQRHSPPVCMAWTCFSS